MESALDNFKTISGGNIASSLSSATQQIDEISASITDIKDTVSGLIIDYSDTIDNYGKMGFKIVFSVLIAVGVALAGLMFLLCFCSGEKCKYCCFIRCGLKLAIHITWNIMALLMILTFLFGSVFVLLGTIGKDLTAVVSYLIGSENLGKGNEAIILGAASDKLNVCINGDGNITSVLNLNGNGFNSFDQLKILENKIIDLQNNVTNLTSQRIAYTKYSEILAKRANYSDTDIYMISLVDGDIKKLTELMGSIHHCSGSVEWDFHTYTSICSDNSGQKFNPYICNACTKCFGSSPCTGDPNFVDNIITLQNLALGNNDISIKKVIKDLNNDYTDYLKAETEAISEFSTSIHSITSFLQDFINEEDGFFSFLNCNFIGTNIRIVIKTLDNSLGGDIYNVGISLVIAGFAMAFSIFFTILMISMLNEKIDQMKN